MIKNKVIYLIIFVTNFFVTDIAHGCVVDSLIDIKIDKTLLMHSKSSKNTTRKDTLIIKDDSSNYYKSKDKESLFVLDESLEVGNLLPEDSSFNSGVQKIVNKHYQEVFDNLSLIEKNRSDSIKINDLRKEIDSLKKIIIQDSIKIFTTIGDKFLFDKKNNVESINKIKSFYNKILEFSELDDNYINFAERVDQIEEKIKKLENIKFEALRGERKIELNRLINEKDTIVEYQIPWNSNKFKLIIGDIKKIQFKSSEDLTSHQDQWVINKKFKSFIYIVDDKKKFINNDEILCSLGGKFQTISNLNNNLLENKFISWFDVKNNLMIRLGTPADKFNYGNLQSLIELLGGNEFIISPLVDTSLTANENKNHAKGAEIINNALELIDDLAIRLLNLDKNISDEKRGLILVNQELQNINAKIKISKAELYSKFTTNETDTLSKSNISKISFGEFQDWLNSIKKYSSRKSKNVTHLRVKDLDIIKISKPNSTNKSRPNGKVIANFENQLINFVNSKEKIPLLVTLELGHSKYRVLLVDPLKNNIHLHDNSSGKLAPLIESWRYFLQEKKIKPVAIVNAGMYEMNGSAKGLLIENKILKNKIDLVDSGSGNFYMQPNGIFFQNLNGGFDILDTKTYNIKYSSANDKLNQKVESGNNFATQSGPMLVVNNAINPQFILNSQNLNIRNGVGISNKWKTPVVVIAISDSKVNFYEFAFLFKSIFGCKNALYLDGAISKMYIKGEKNNDLKGELGPKLLVTEK